MEKQAIIKVEGGKMIRINLSYTDKIEHIKITGDFFLHPEENIEKLEDELIGANKKEIHEILRKFFKNVESIGADIEDFYEAIISAIN